jgi:catechol 2,3-dioxygenase-like lactoylglutathione lyase family enzyme
MNITNLERLVFGVDDTQACAAFLAGMGLEEAQGVFRAQDGTGVAIHARDDAALPTPLETGSMLRETVYGVGDAQTLDALGANLSRDRTVTTHADGSIGFYDDDGFALRFVLSNRRGLSVPASVLPNVAGTAAGRGTNVTGLTPGAAVPRPRTLSHLVYFVPDARAAEAFYVERLGFRCTDRFTGVGPFLRPAGMADHHALFLIQTPPHMKGIEHFAFHMDGPSDVMEAGTHMVEAGFQSFWGPGRHYFGSNWFWYFNCPMGCHAEFDADMDQHDDAWVARAAPLGPDASQAFLFRYQEKWMPGGPPPKAAGNH